MSASKRFSLILISTLLAGCLTLGSKPPAVDLEQAPAAATPLDGQRWSLLQLGGQWVVIADSRQTPWITVDGARQQVSGFDGCNRLSAPLRLLGERLRIGPLVVTRITCPPSMAPEKEFQDALSQAAIWRSKAGMLEFLDAEGEPLLLLRSEDR